MLRYVRFRPLAQSDVDEAVAWYGDKRPTLALAFLESLNAVVNRIREMPEQFPVVRRDVRRALLERFPYGVFFVVDSSQIDVLAVVHLNRKPSTWQRRA